MSGKDKEDNHQQQEQRQTVMSEKDNEDNEHEEVNSILEWETKSIIEGGIGVGELPGLEDFD